MTNNYLKYIKYKNKYLNLKYTGGGSDKINSDTKKYKTICDDINKLKNFTDDIINQKKNICKKYPNINPFAINYKIINKCITENLSPSEFMKECILLANQNTSSTTPSPTPSPTLSLIQPKLSPELLKLVTNALDEFNINVLDNKTQNYQIIKLKSATTTDQIIKIINTKIIEIDYDDTYDIIYKETIMTNIEIYNYLTNLFIKFLNTLNKMIHDEKINEEKGNEEKGYDKEMVDYKNNNLIKNYEDNLKIYFKLISIILNHTHIQDYQIIQLEFVTTKEQIIRIINSDIDDSGKIIYKKTVTTNAELETYLSTLFTKLLRIIEITKMLNKEGPTCIKNIILDMTKKYNYYENNYNRLIDILKKNKSIPLELNHNTSSDTQQPNFISEELKILFTINELNINVIEESQDYQLKQFKSAKTLDQIIKIINSDIDIFGDIIYKKTVMTNTKIYNYLTELFSNFLNIIKNMVLDEQNNKDKGYDKEVVNNKIYYLIYHYI
jgi:hypothetical protein